MSHAPSIDPTHSTHTAGCTCGSCCGPGLDEAFARNGRDRDASWYKPARRVSANAGGDANPVYDVNAAGLPLLTSRSDGVGLKIFLDFDGNGGNLPFGLDSDDSTFNTQEQLAIYETWRDIISYFSPFNVNVTTVQPATGGTPFVWHLTSKSISGGYAYVNSLTTSEPTGFNEAGDAVGRHSGIAHEIGHIMGLSHQGEWDKLGVNVTEYTEGFGARDVSIMGVDFGTNVRTWIYGRTSSSASSIQDDVAVLASKTASVVGGDGFRPDDLGNTTASAHVVPGNVQRIPAILERMNDADVFRISPSTAGPWHIDATPTYESAASPRIELLDAAGNVIASRDDADQRNQRNNDVEFTVDLQPGTYYVRVSSSGDYGEIGEYLFTASPLMPGFVSTDISTTIDRGGTASYDPVSGVLTQLGAGSDIWSTADQFRFTYDTIVGDGSITTRVLSLDNTDANAKAGVMFRSTVGNTSAFVMISVKPGGQIELIRRSSTSASAATIASATPASLPIYLRLTRSGTTYTGFYSTDGTSWTTLGTTTATLFTNTLVGFATTSHNTREAAFAEFDQIAVTGTLGEAAPTYNSLQAPTGLTAAAAPGASTGNGSIVLNWNAVPDATLYHIERSVDGVNYTRFTSSTQPTYTDPNVWGSMRWWYRVTAATASSNSSVPSAAVSVVSKPNVPATPPTSYAVPAISAPSGNAIYLNWMDVQGDEGYRIERSTNGTSFITLTTVAKNITAYNDNTAAANTGYVYRITPITGVGDGVGSPLSFEAGTRWTSSNFRTIARSANTITLAWNDFATETGYRVERTTNGVTGWSTVANLNANQTSWTNVSLSSLTEYYYRIVADLPVSEIISSSIAFASTLASSALPTGWSDVDVGTTGGWGMSGSTDGGSTYRVIGGGTNIGGAADSMRYLYRSLTGDGSITVRLASQKSNDIDDNAEAGIMIRESINPGAKYVFINTEPGRGGRTDLESRSTTGGSVSNTNGPSQQSPVWMRLTRAGSTFTAEYSTNGTTWTSIGTRSISMTNGVLIGMAVSAVESNLLSFATFSNVSITGDLSANQAPYIYSPAFAPAAPVKTVSAALNVVAGDDSGQLTYTWSLLSGPANMAEPTFDSRNGTSTGNNVSVTFYGIGTYTLRALIVDAAGLSRISDVTVQVVPTLTSLGVTPASSSVAPGATQAFSVSGLDQFGAPMTSPAVNWSASAGSITAAGLFTAPANAGPVTITATSNESAAITGTTTVNVALVAGTPTYDVSTASHTIRIPLNGNVGASFGLEDITLTSVVGGAGFNPPNLTASFSDGALFVKFDGTAIADGQYRLQIESDGVTLTGGQALSADLTFDFTFLRGDVTGDGTVGFDDLLIVAQNYGGSGRTYTQGDLNYDGEVNFDDLLALAQRYGTGTVQAAPATTTKVATTTAKRRGTSVIA